MSFIAVEGPIGAGKTSLSRLLAESLGAQLVLEVVEENPFLAPFYRDPERYAFSAQTFFLLSRFKQVQEMRQGSLFFTHTVADYLFDKDVIFASLNLRGDEWRLYEELYTQLRPKLPEPDLTVYLRATPDLLLERIAKRARPFEQDLEAAYLQALGEAYDRYFERYAGPLCVIEAREYDFVENARDRERLLGLLLGRAQSDPERAQQRAV
ncbi:deoxynucleoside kinase [Truepera radiovictrix]|uniref:Deoxynucleoside kinase n=1 Tax=Truepera radiovictrix (strain DSM 17093 / CIP 108686 / LMG 22925 / RQ-24) TaxID=649638 RepID=D7CVL6_TRURR|nr:deoxynucleoside kinase [Truepera radiovictrix]ADI15927.1 deoxynucleoside kinase [Truepera radiovictrix DSM 17093]WMT58446.1 deoxynucleoside kinase [Truepera radiovictrix]